LSAINFIGLGLGLTLMFAYIGRERYRHRRVSTSRGIGLVAGGFGVVTAAKIGWITVMADDLGPFPRGDRTFLVLAAIALMWASLTPIYRARFSRDNGQ